jgi:2-oxoglutarate ferredoxin oxidoreductase subunit beta
MPIGVFYKSEERPAYEEETLKLIGRALIEAELQPREALKLQR